MTEARPTPEPPRTVAGRELLEATRKYLVDTRLWDRDAALDNYRAAIIAIEAEAARPANPPTACECGNGCLMPHQHYNAAAYEMSYGSRSKLDESSTKGV